MLCASTRPRCSLTAASTLRVPARRSIATTSASSRTPVRQNKVPCGPVPAVDKQPNAPMPAGNFPSTRRSYSSSRSSSSAMPKAHGIELVPEVSYAGAALAAAVTISALYLFADDGYAAEDTISASVAKASSLKDGDMREAKVGDVKILIAKVGGKIYATDLNCPHYGAPLNTGVLAGESVSCPWHDARFNLKTGALEDAPALDGINTYQVTIQGDDVIVTVPAKPKPRTPVGKKCDSCDKRTFVIVGAGAAGVTAAEALRQDGFKGRIVMLTDESKLPYDRTALSKNPGVPAEKITLRDEVYWKAMDVEVQRERKVLEVDVKTRTIRFDDGSTMSYDSCLLATGSSARTLPLPGADLENVKTLRGLEDSSAIASLATPQSKVVVIGSSFIGIELASALKKGKKVENVVVVGMEKVPFERVLGTEVGAIIQALAEENGVKVVMQHTAARFEGQNGKVTKVILDDKTEIPADLVVVGAGAVPNTKIVKNLPLNKDGSISVDSHMKVPNAENLFAAGDIARFPWQGEDIRVEHWSVAQNQGRVAGHNMAGRAVEFENVPFFWTRSFDMSLTYAGHASSYDEVLVKGDKKKKQFVAFYVKDNKVKAVAALGRGPQAVAASDLFRMNKMPSAEEIRAAADVDLTDVLKRAQHFI